MYPDAPGPRMAYDIDGTLGELVTSGGVVTSLSAANMAYLNDENNTNGIAVSQYGHLVLIFPQLRDIVGTFVRDTTGSGNVSCPISVSSDTTNGIDGTWATLRYNAINSSIVPDYRTVIADSAVGVKAIRISGVNVSYSPTVYAIHLYGSISATSDRLVFWHSTLDEPLPGAYFDWGDVPQNTSATRDFRVKNLSDTMTAGAITISTSVLTDSSPSILPQHTITYDGGAFDVSASITSLSPGAISNICTLQRTSPANAQLGLRALRMHATAASWS